MKSNRVHIQASLDLLCVFNFDRCFLQRAHIDSVLLGGWLLNAPFCLLVFFWLQDFVQPFFKLLALHLNLIFCSDWLLQNFWDRSHGRQSGLGKGRF